MSTTVRNAVQTDASAYPSDQYEHAPIKLNITQTVWDWSTYDIVHQSSTGHYLTVEEAQAVIETLTKAITQLNK